MVGSQQSATVEDIRRSDDFKAQGNIYFGKKDFQSALASYTAALSLAPTETLYSNRSATLLQLNRTSEALDDADIAVALNPTWSKGHRRKGNVLETLGRFEDAVASYCEARRLEQEPSVQASLTRTIDVIEKRIRERHEARQGSDNTVTSPDIQAATLIFREVEARIARGETPGEWPPVGSCAQRLWLADIQWAEALRSLSQYQKHNLPDTATPGSYGISGPLQTLAELTSAALEDPRVIVLKYEDLEKLQWCYLLEQQQRSAVGPGLDVRQAIATYQDRIRIGISWDEVRPALQLSIRAALMNGMVLDMAHGGNSSSSQGETAVDYLRRAVGLLEEARRVFADVPGQIRGRTLETTFLRGLKVRLGEALIKQFHATSPPPLSIVHEIRSLGDWLLASYAAEPLPEGDIPPRGTHDSDKFWTLYLPYWRYPRAMGHMFRGLAYMQLGLTWNQLSLDGKNGERGPLAGNAKDLKVAAEEYVKASAWLPEDDPEASNFMWYAILCTVRRGSYYLGDLILLRDVALAQSRLWSPYFGTDYIPSSHVGKLASSEALAQSEGADPSTICSPLVEWPRGIAIDSELLGEVMMPYIASTIRMPESEGGGMLLLGRVLKDAWAERSAIGEPNVGWLWNMVDVKTRDQWQKVANVHERNR